MKKKYDIIIGGGGVIGLTIAIALAEQGLSVAIVDDKPPTTEDKVKFDGRAYALSSATVKMLSVLGIWKELVKTAQPILDMKVSEGKAGKGASPFFMHFDHKDMDSGPIGYMVEDRFLKQILLNKLFSNKSISKFYGAKIVDQEINQGIIEVHFENKTSIAAKLLVGSDGRTSMIGERSGIKRNTFDYQQTSIVCAVSHEKDHLGEAHQFFMPAGPLAILPLQNNISSIVWTEQNQKADQLKKISDKKFYDELKIRFGGFRGKISLEGQRYFFPLSLSISKTLISNRVALVGDAAHAVHPVAGQGLNLGMRDVASLVEIITLARRRGEDYGLENILSSYATWREFDRVTLYGFTHLINQVFSNDSPFLKTFRGIGMVAINNIPMVQRFLMREASGFGQGLPLLMSGRRI